MGRLGHLIIACGAQLTFSPISGGAAMFSCTQWNLTIRDLRMTGTGCAS
jgi:hypothetical protein